MYKTTVKTQTDYSLKYSAVDRSRNRLYVLCEDTDVVLVFNISSNIVIDSIPVAPDGSHLIIDSSNSKLYITCSTKDIYVYDLATRQISSNFKSVNALPNKIYLNESEDKLYIFCANGKMDIYKISDLTLISSNTASNVTYGETYIPGSAPTTTTFAPSTGEYAKLLVSDNTNAGAVQSIAFPSKTVTGLSGAKGFPEKFVVDEINQKVYLSNKSSQFVQVIDENNAMTDITLPIVGGVSSLSLDVDDQILYVLDNNTDVLLVVRLSDNSIIQRINVDEFSTDCVFDNFSKSVFILNMESKSLSIVNTVPSRMTVETFSLTFEPFRIVLDSNQRKLYVLSHESNAVYVIDIQSLSNIKIGLLFHCYHGSNILLDESQQFMYVTLPESDRIIVFDTKNNRIHKYVRGLGGSPRGMALDKEAKRLYVANTRSSAISIIDTSSNNVIETINSVGTVPYDLALAAKVTTTTTTTAAPSYGTTITIPAATNQISSANKYLAFIGAVGDKLKFDSINTADGYSVDTQYAQDADPSTEIDDSVDIILYVSNSATFRICAATQYVTQDRPFQIISGSNTYNSTFGAGSVVSGSTRRIDLS